MDETSIPEYVGKSGVVADTLDDSAPVEDLLSGVADDFFDKRRRACGVFALAPDTTEVGAMDTNP